VKCDFAQTFSIDSMHRHGGPIKISHVGNSCNCVKLSKKILFSRIRCGIFRSVCAGLRRSGALQICCKSWGFP